MRKARKWTDGEIAELVNQAKKVKLPMDIKISNRTPRAIYHKYCQLREQKLLGYVSRPWSKEEDSSILQQANEGKGLDDISIPGRSKEQAYHRIKKLRKKGVKIILPKKLTPVQIAARQRRQVIETAKAKRQQELNELKNFLEGEGRNWPTCLVAKKFSMKGDCVGRWRKKWGLKVDYLQRKECKVLDEHLKKIMAKKLFTKKRKKQQAKERKFNRQFAILQKLNGEFASLVAKRCPSNLKSCAQCKRVWFDAAPFFKEKLDICEVCLA